MNVWGQLLIALFGVTAVALSQSTHVERRKWAPILGLIAQPFWFWATYATQQWGIFALCFLYTAVWFKGLYVGWFADGKWGQLKAWWSEFMYGKTFTWAEAYRSAERCKNVDTQGGSMDKHSVMDQAKQFLADGPLNEMPMPTRKTLKPNFDSIGVVTNKPATAAMAERLVEIGGRARPLPANRVPIEAWAIYDTTGAVMTTLSSTVANAWHAAGFKLFVLREVPDNG